MAITFPKVGVASFTASSASLDAGWTGGGSTAAGSMIAVAGSFDSVATDVTLTCLGASGGTVTDSVQGLITDTTGGWKSFVKAFFAPAAGVTTVRATYSGTNPTFGDIFIWEIAGITNPTFDKVATTSNTSVSPADSGATGTLSASSEGAIAYGVASTIAYTTPGTGWTSDGVATGTSSLGEHQILSSNASINGTGVFSAGSQFWRFWAATFMQAQTQAPFLNRDWPNPRDKERLSNYTWIQLGRSLPTVTVLPSNLRVQRDWPNPKPITWYRSWEESTRLPRPTPFIPVDQPNPLSVYWYRDWNQNLLETTLRVTSRPFVQTDWPNPTSIVWDRFWSQGPTQSTPSSVISEFNWQIDFGPQYPIQSWIYSSLQLLTASTPFVQRDWPNPQPIVWYKDWFQNLLQNTLKPVFQAPFNQLDWPLPRTYKPIDQFWFESGNVQLPFPTPFFQNVDFPLPVVSQPIDQTWIQNLSNFFQSETFPFSQKDWPLPYPIQWYRDFYQALALYFPTVFPTRQSDYPNPRTYAPIDQFWTNNLNQLPVVSTTKPFNQNDWPLPRDYQRIDENFFQSLVLNLPEPPPPLVITSAGRWISPEEVISSIARKYGRIGGLASADSRTAAERSLLASIAAAHRWKK